MTKRVSPFLRQLVAVSGVVMYMIGTGANIAYPGVLLKQLREPDSAVQLTAEHESWIGGGCMVKFVPETKLDAVRRDVKELLRIMLSSTKLDHKTEPRKKINGQDLLFSSLLGLALILGIVSAPFSLQRLGRRMTNQLSTLPSLAGWALLVTARGPAALLASRALQGFGMGIQAAAAPITIAEYSSPKHRGAFLATIAFSFATGMLLAHIFGTLMYWRPAGIACGSFYAISLILLSISPETPPYLASRGLQTQCRKSFRWFRGSNDESEKELEIMINSQRKAQIANTLAPKEPLTTKLVELVKKPEFYKPTLIMMFMFILFQISGMTVIPSYTVFIMNAVTNESIDPSISMLMVDVVRFATAVLACVVVNKLNRRTVLFLGIIVSSLALLVTALMMYLRDSGHIKKEYEWAPVIPALVYIFGKTLGILPIPWAIAGEIFPLAYRSIGSGISGMFLSVMFFIVVKTAPDSFDKIGVAGTFTVYAVCIAVCGIILYFLLPETRGKTLYEIECHFRGVKDDLGVSEDERMLELQRVEGG